MSNGTQGTGNTLDSLVRLCVGSLCRQPGTRAPRHCPLGLPGGSAARALLGEQLCSSHGDSDGSDRLRAGREPRQPRERSAGGTKRFALEGSHTQGRAG